MPTRIDIAKKDDGKWVRPGSWLPIDNLVSVGEHKFVGLCAVIDGQVNQLKVRIGGVNYTVDWGDGTIENYGASVYSNNHTYNFSTISSPLTEEGWKQVVVKIYPTNPADTFSSYVFVDQSTRIVNHWLDIKMASSTCNTLTVGSVKKLPYLKKFTYAGPHANMAMNSNFLASAIEEFDMDFSNITSLASMFQSNAGRIFKDDDTNITAASTSTTSMFQSSNIETVGDFTITGTTALLQTFYMCNVLKRIGNVTALNVNNIQSFALQCSSLKTVGNINVPTSTNLVGCFQNCYLLESVGTITTSSLMTSMTNTFANCFALKGATITNCSGVTVATSAFSGCGSLKQLSLSGIKVSFSVIDTALDRAALVSLFNDLGTPVTTQIITVTGTPGSANLTAADILIATSKNWTVTL